MEELWRKLEVGQRITISSYSDQHIDVIEYIRNVRNIEYNNIRTVSFNKRDEINFRALRRIVRRYDGQDKLQTIIRKLDIDNTTLVQKKELTDLEYAKLNLMLCLLSEASHIFLISPFQNSISFTPLFMEFLCLATDKLIFLLDDSYSAMALADGVVSVEIINGLLKTTVLELL